MTILTVAVCEDVPEDARELKNCLRKVLPGADVKVFTDGDELLRLIEKKGNPYSAIFLSIEMEKKNGIDTARMIRMQDMSVPIILTSANENHYREAFAVFAHSYILKPISRKTLESVLYPLKCRWGETDERVIHFRYRSQVYTLRHSQVTYISSSLHTVNFHMTDGRIVHCRGKLNDFTEQLKDTNFLRCHQSFYVNMEEIVAMKNDSFTLRENVIPISRSYSRIAHEKYTEFLEKRTKE